MDILTKFNIGQKVYGYKITDVGYFEKDELFPAEIVQIDIRIIGDCVITRYVVNFESEVKKQSFYERDEDFLFATEIELEKFINEKNERIIM